MSDKVQRLQKLLEEQKKLLDTAQSDWQRREQQAADLDRRDFMMSEADKRLREEIFDAVAKSQYPKARLQQIARAHGVRYEQVEEIGDRIAKGRLGEDLEAIEFNSMVTQVKNLEETVEDQGLREWKIQTLAKRYGRSPVQLMAAYAKALINQAPVEPLTLRELKESHGEEIDWLVPGWLIRGTTLLLHADGGIGKTLFCYDLIQSLVTGTPWNGYPVSRQKVLLVQLDEPPFATIERCELRGIPQDDIHILGDWQAENLPRLASYLEKERPDFILIDSLTAVNRNSCFSENDTEYARPILHMADLAARLNCTVLFIHHSSAGGRARGTTAIRNSVSEVWHLDHHNVALQERALTVEKTRLGKPPGKYKFTFHPDDYSFTYEGEMQGEVMLESDPSQLEKIRLWLSEEERCGVAYAIKEIAELMQLNENTCRRSCREAWTRQLIKRRRSRRHKGYVYFVEGRQGQILELSQANGQGSDPRSHADHLADHFANPCLDGDSAPSDQVISEKPVFQENSENPKKADQFDHLITPRSKCQAQQGRRRNVTSDQPSDQPVSPPDHLCDKAQITGEKALSPPTVVSKNEHSNCHTILSTKELIKPGSKVLCKAQSDFFLMCGRKEMEVSHVEGDRVWCWHPHWTDSKPLPIEDLELAGEY